MRNSKYGSEIVLRLNNMANILECYQTFKICVEQLEDDIKDDLAELNKLVTQSTNDIDKSFVLEKAKFFHYKEILKHLNEIKSQISLIKYHDEKIRDYSQKKTVDIDELKKYSYVQQQIRVFSKIEDPDVQNYEVNHRKKRQQTNSEISMKSLDMWEKFLETNDTSKSTTNFLEIPKRTNKRNIRKGKHISSTFMEFLDDYESDSSSENSFKSAEGILDSGDEEDINEDSGKRKMGSSVLDLLDTLDIAEDLQPISEEILNETEEEDEEETIIEKIKPKIIDVILKKTMADTK